MRPSASVLGRWLGASLLFVAAGSCRTPRSPSGFPTELPPSPMCALTAADVLAGNRSQLILSARTGPPAAGNWGRFMQHHQPEVPVGTPDFVWTFIRDVDEAPLPLANGQYQVHVWVVESNGDLTFMAQTPRGDWGTPTRLLGPERIVPSGQPGGPLGTDAGRTALFRRVSAVSVEGRLHVCASEREGQLERNVFDPATGRLEGWTDLERSAGTERGDFFDVGCAAVQNPTTGQEELHVCGVTSDGRLWHALESPARTFSSLEDVEGVAGEVGEFAKVECAGNRGQLHLVGLTRAGKAWHTVRIPSGWSPFEEVLAAALPDPALPVMPRGEFRELAIGFCNAGVPLDGPRDVSQLNVVLTEPSNTNEPWRVWHTIRATNPVEWEVGTPKHWRELVDLTPTIRNAPPTLPASEALGRPESWQGFSVGFRPKYPY